MSFWPFWAFEIYQIPKKNAIWNTEERITYWIKRFAAPYDYICGYIRGSNVRILMKNDPNNSVLPIISQVIAWKHIKQPENYNEDEALEDSI